MSRRSHAPFDRRRGLISDPNQPEEQVIAATVSGVAVAPEKGCYQGELRRQPIQQQQSPAVAAAPPASSRGSPRTRRPTRAGSWSRRGRGSPTPPPGSACEHAPNTERPRRTDGGKARDGSRGRRRDAGRKALARGPDPHRFRHLSLDRFPNPFSGPQLTTASRCSYRVQLLAPSATMRALVTSPAG